MIEVKDIAEYEENDSELAKYTISKLSSEKKDLQQRIDKVIEYATKHIELNNGALSNREELIVSKHDLIKSETKLLNCFIDILRGEDND